MRRRSKPLSQFLQDSDGNWDEQAALSVVGVFTGCLLEGYSVIVLHRPFDFQQFGIGFGAVMAATLGGLAYRESKGKKDARVPDQPGS